jgi:ribonuclease R
VPKVTVLRIVDVTDEGTPIAVPERWEADQPPPRLRVVVKGKRDPLGSATASCRAPKRRARAGWRIR